MHSLRYVFGLIYVSLEILVKNVFAIGIRVFQIKYSDQQEMLRFLFREAKIHNAVVFFDECEMLFESRDHHPSVTLALMLTEVRRKMISVSCTVKYLGEHSEVHNSVCLYCPQGATCIAYVLDYMYCTSTLAYF